MDIRKKLLALLLILALVFAGIFVFHNYTNTIQLKSYVRGQIEQTTFMFDSILNLLNDSINTLAYDYSFWDEMISFISTKDNKWAEANLDPALSTYKVDFIWVYAVDGSLIYSVSTSEGDNMKELPLPDKEGIFDKLSKERLMPSFFTTTPKGIILMSAATIHPGADKDRKTPPQGYFFAGRLWDKAYLKKFSHLMGGAILVTPLNEDEMLSKVIPVGSYVITSFKLLYNWKGEEILRATIWIELPFIKDSISAFNRTSALFVILVAFSFIITILLLNYWITVPLGRISAALKNDDPARIKRLRNYKTEFGSVAKLIYQFFEQKKDLIKEISERKHVENELKEAQAQLVHAEKMKAVGKMASGVAHEVKNPLGIILQGINYFEGELPPDEKNNREMLQMMKNSVKRADSIVRALLDFSRKEELKIDGQDINSIIESSIELVRHRLGNIELVCELEKGLPQTLMDRGKIEQVFVNLFNNAVDAMPRGGKIYVRSYLSELKKPMDKIGNKATDIFRVKEKVMIVEVEDTGSGIGEDIINRIFDPFFTTKNRTEGTGLGLSIAMNIIEIHKGLISVESKNGKGTKFTIVFKIPGEKRD